jgi:outer membrane protein assembly factor BamE (lipoprotein component of BamABCDE complex)
VFSSKNKVFKKGIIMFFQAKTILYVIILPFLAASCNARNFYDETYCETKKFELGLIQKEIHEGMTQDQVAITIGSPNIVTFDQGKKEAWIYDKIATEVRQSGSSGFILFCQTGADYVSRTDRSQKTLTVVIKFNSDKLVESVSYHSSRF